MVTSRNLETLAMAWVGDYEVTEERYYIKLPFTNNVLNEIETNPVEHVWQTKEEFLGFKVKFTEDEIKEIDSSLWALAVPTEED